MNIGDEVMYIGCRTRFGLICDCDIQRTGWKNRLKQIATVIFEESSNHLKVQFFDQASTGFKDHFLLVSDVKKFFEDHIDQLLEEDF